MLLDNTILHYGLCNYLTALLTPFSLINFAATQPSVMIPNILLLNYFKQILLYYLKIQVIIKKYK